MGFSTPAWISQLPPPPAENAIDAGNKGALAGYELGQKRAVRAALNSLDAQGNDPSGHAVGALVRAGAADTAGGILNLGMTRQLYGSLPGIMDKISRLGTTDTSQPAPPASDDGTITPDHVQHVADTMGMASDAVKQIRALPPEQRAAAFAAAKPGFVQRGLPEAAVDAVGADLSDAGLDKQIAYLSAHADHFNAPAGPDGSSPPAPAMAHPTQFGWASQLENDPGLQLGLAFLKARGIDLSGMTDTAKALVLPQVEAQAKADFAQQTAQGTTAGTNLANTNPATAPAPFAGAVHGTLPSGQPGFVAAPGAIQGQTAVAGAAAIGTEAGSHGGEVTFHADGSPVVSAVPGATTTAAAYEGGVGGAKAGAEAAATSPTHVINLPTPDGGEISGSMVKGPNGWTFQPVAGGSGAPGGIGHAVTPQQAAVNKASADQLVAERQSSGQLQSQLIPLRTAYGLIHGGNVNLGPGSETVNRMRSFVTSTLGMGDQSQVASYDQVHKYLVQIANQRAQQFGQGTNEKLAVAASGSPNVEMSNLGAAEVLRVNIALARAEAAKAASYTGPPEGYTAYAANYGRTVDPRAFMVDMLSKPEYAALYRQIEKGTDAEKAAFARGIKAAVSANIFSQHDIPR